MKLYYHDLEVWKKSMDLAVAIIQLTQRFPSHERFGLAAQMRKAAVSIPSNIAESQGRYGRGESQEFLYYARGSLYEAETQIMLAQRLGYLTTDAERAILQSSANVGRLLNGLIDYVRRQKQKGSAKRTGPRAPSPEPQSTDL